MVIRRLKQAWIRTSTRRTAGWVFSKVQFMVSSVRRAGCYDVVYEPDKFGVPLQRPGCKLESTRKAGLVRCVASGR